MNRKAWTGLCLVVILLAAWVLGPVPAFAMDEDNPSGMTEVKAGIGYTIQFARGDGSGSMEPVFWTKREAYELPPCDFTAPAGQVFKEWSVKIGDAEAVSKQPDESVVVTADTIVTAVWGHTVTIAEGINGTVKLSGEQTAFAKGETVKLTVNAAAGYAIGTVSYNDGSDHTIEPVDGVYSFTMPAANVTVSADFVPASITYLDADGKEQTCQNCTLLTGSETVWTDWVVASGTVEINGRVTVSGAAHLILMDGAALTIPKGIRVGDGNSLTIHKSPGDTMGALTINGVEKDNAGIGGNANESGGAITICGGDITAKGGSGGAGIGGGRGGNLDGTFQMTGGKVYVESGYNAAGIGGGSQADGCGGDGGVCFIGGGDLTVCLKENTTKAEAIGAGQGGNSSGSVYINKNNNKTGKYMQVATKIGNDDMSTVKADKRSSMCHSRADESTPRYVYITECDHKEHFTGESGFDYVFDEDGHTGTCRYCGYSDSETHPHTYNDVSDICTVCEYNAGFSFVFFNSNSGSEVPTQMVVNGQKAVRPEDPTHEEGLTFKGWYETMSLDGALAPAPFDFENRVLDHKLVILQAVWVHEHDGITFQPWDSAESLPAEAGDYYLTKDVTLTDTWTWSSGDLNLCLNGCTVSAAGQGQYGLRITGGKVDLFDEEGGTITQAGAISDAIVFVEGGILYMHGGAVTGSAHTGVSVSSDGGMSISRDVRIRGNDEHNVFLSGGAVLWVAATLDENARIGVSMEADSGVITTGLSGRGSEQNFSADEDNCIVTVHDDCEAYIDRVFTVTFDSDGGTDVSTQTVPDGGKATKPAGPTKDGYRFLGWFAENATEAFDFNTPVTADITLTAHWKKVYTVTIDAEGCIVNVTAEKNVTEEGDDGTPVNSGDQVDEDTPLTVTATRRAGYVMTTIPDASYTVTGDLTITARATKITYALTLTHEHGADPAVTGTNDLTAIPYGTEVTVTAGEADEGYEFIGWFRPDNYEKLPGGVTYTFDISSDTALEARYQTTGGVVTFVSDDIIQKTIPSATEITVQDFPTDPTPMYGFVFKGWDKTADKINEELTKGSNVTVKAVFAPVKKNIIVKIYNGESDEATTQTYTESRWLSVTAQAVDGKSFAYWTLDGELLSYNAKCSFRVTQDCVFKAVYSEEPTEPIGTALIKTARYDLQSRELVFVAYMTVPEGAVISTAGLVSASGVSTKYTAGTELTKDNADYVKVSAPATGTSVPATYTWTKTNVGIGDVWYARGYVTYTLKGVETTIYSAMVTVHAGCDFDSSEKATATLRSSKYNANVKEAVFVAYMTVPSDGVIVKAGLVAAPATTFDATSTLLTWDTATYKKVSAPATGTSVPATYTWTKTAVEKNDTWYVRPYVIYTDAKGLEHTVYGELLTFVA